MPEQIGRDDSGSPFGIRSIIQLVAMTVAIVLFVVGLQMAFGVYRLVQDTLLSPEHFAQVVETWAAPAREAAGEERAGEDPGQPFAEEAREQTREETRAEKPLPADHAEPIAPDPPPDEVSHSSISGQVDADTPDPVVPSESEPGDPESVEVSPEGEDPRDASPFQERDPEETLDAEATENGEQVEEPAETEPAEGIVAPATEAEAAWPPPRDARERPAGPLDVLERFLINLNQQDLGRAGAGLLIVLFLFVLVKIPIALLTVGGNILVSLLKTSQTVQSITVRSGKSNSNSRRQRADDDSDRPLQVGDLTS